LDSDKNSETRESLASKTGASIPDIPTSAVPTSDASTSDAGGAGVPASTVPDIVAESQKEAHVSPEASANEEAVEEKKAVEAELLQQTGHVTGNVAGNATTDAGISSKPVTTFDDMSSEGGALKESSNRAVALDDTPATKTETFEFIPSTKATELGPNPTGLQQVTAIRPKPTEDSSSANPVPFESMTSDTGKSVLGGMSSGTTSGFDNTSSDKGKSILSDLSSGTTGGFDNTSSHKGTSTLGGIPSDTTSGSGNTFSDTGMSTLGGLSSGTTSGFGNTTSDQGKSTLGGISSGTTSGSTTIGEHGPSHTSTNAFQGGVPVVIPSENIGVAPSSGGLAESKLQGADRPTDAPTGEQLGAVRESKNEAENLLYRDPNDRSGEPMKMHGGSDFDQRRESKAGNPGGQEHGKEAKGSGEQWVKTSGVAADGGDFDATKPGAGREADRRSTMMEKVTHILNEADGVAGLLEQKGIHRSDVGKSDTSHEVGSSETAEKPSKMEKLKEKLHIGHHSKGSE
jgi:hypothetical protein